MVELFIVLIAGSLIVGLSVRANDRFRQEERLPMQWSFSGTVNWTAPRPLALSFTPVLAICIMSAAALAMQLSEPREGQEGLEVPILLFMGVVFVSVHLLHLRLIDRTLRGKGS